MGNWIEGVTGVFLIEGISIALFFVLYKFFAFVTALNIAFIVFVLLVLAKINDDKNKKQDLSSKQYIQRCFENKFNKLYYSKYEEWDYKNGFKLFYENFDDRSQAWIMVNGANVKSIYDENNFYEYLSFNNVRLPKDFDAIYQDLLDWYALNGNRKRTFKVSDSNSFKTTE